MLPELRQYTKQKCQGRDYTTQMFEETRHRLLPLLQKNWRSLVLLLLGILLPLLLAMDLTEDVFRHGGFAWDVAVLEWYRQHRTPTLTAIAKTMAVVGGVWVIPLLTTVAALFFAKAGAKAQGWFLLLSVLGATLINVTAKVIFQRPRPEQLLAVLSEPGFSFPSGHTMANAALGVALALIFFRSKRFRFVGLLGLLWAVLMGMSRNYLGVHYPTDVLVGFLTSLAWVTGLWFVMRPHFAHLGQSPAGPADTLPDHSAAHHIRP